jgi:hypothetical protein
VPRRDLHPLARCRAVIFVSLAIALNSDHPDFYNRSGFQITKSKIGMGPMRTPYLGRDQYRFWALLRGPSSTQHIRQCRYLGWFRMAL